jgi:uncharacterized protein YegL
MANIVMILDKSGSMSSIQSDIIGSINQFITDQKKIADTATFTFVTFSDNVEVVFFKKPLSEVQTITDNDYKPTGSTALFDAIGLTINKFEHDKDVLMVIVTDGQENASKRYKRKEIFDMVSKHKGKNGWNFIYLSADIDTFDQGTSLGFGTSGFAGNNTCVYNKAVGYSSLSSNIAGTCSKEVDKMRTKKTF